MNDFDQQSFAFNAVEAPIEDIVAISTPQLDKNDELLELDQRKPWWRKTCGSKNPFQLWNFNQSFC